jgi:hypothetical protein
MTETIARDPIYRRRRFQSETIELCVRWYLTPSGAMSSVVPSSSVSSIFCSVAWLITLTHSDTSPTDVSSGDL